MSVQRCQRETTSTEFLAWQEYIRRDRDIPSREHYYLAQIASEVRRSIVKHPRSVRPEHFILHFTSRQEKPPLTEQEREARCSTSKARWMALVGHGRPPPKRG